MFSNKFNYIVFVAGLAVVGWIGAGYLGSNLLGLGVVLVIGACHVAGGIELWRYGQATATLEQATDEVMAEADAPVADLGAWLGRLHPSLRHAVRLRVEGERVALPGPALTPYLVGLLVLLGMLGTLLGMMVTLRGTGLALESATDLQAIRESLAAPVKGLGFAFGTSIAGVAASATLGLCSALCRRRRQQAVQQLDAAIATRLRTHSQAHQREETLRLLQQQAGWMPVLVERLQALMDGIEQRSQTVAEQQLARQQAFHEGNAALHAQLAASVEQSLKAGIADSARVTGEALQPLMASTMQALASQASGVQDGIDRAVQRQLQALSSGFEQHMAGMAGAWDQALDAQQRSGEALAGELRAQMEGFRRGQEQGAAALLETVSQRLEATASQASALHEAVSQGVQQQVQALSAELERNAGAVATLWNTAIAAQQQSNQRMGEDLQRTLAQFGESFEQRSSGLLEGVFQRLDATAGNVAGAWAQALAEQQEGQQQLADHNQRALEAATASFGQRATALVEAVDQSHAQLQAALAEHDRQRLDAWSEALAAMGTALHGEWAQAGRQAETRQQAICDRLAEVAQDITAQTQAHARDTIAEVSRLVQTASEAPRAAAGVIAELRQSLSESMVRDTAMLEERTRLLGTLETLLDAVNHASSEQRSAIDALVSTSADLLERVGTRFTAQVEAETGKLETAAAEVAAGALDVASLGDAFAGAVQQFGEVNAALGERLQGIEAALEKSLARSDEQLAYYVAQAREVVDLSLLSQKQILEDLQQLSGERPAPDAEAA